MNVTGTLSAEECRQLNNPTSLQKIVAVNAAFLQEIKDSNPDLWHAVHRLRQVCHCDGQPMQATRGLIEQLEIVRDRLAIQFALEECYGFVELPKPPPSLVRESVRISQLARLAIADHCSLYLELSDLAEAAQDLQFHGVVNAGLRNLIESVEAFEEKLRRHEAMENELIESSLCLIDINASDKNDFHPFDKGDAGELRKDQNGQLNYAVNRR